MADLRDSPKPISRAWPLKRTFYGWAIVFAALSASFGEVPAFGPILGIFMKPMEEELGWSRATIALGFTIGSLVGSFVSMVVGRLADQYGARLVVAIAGLLISSAMLAISQVQEPWQFWASFGVARASAVAGVELGTSVAVAKWFYRKRARTLALKGMGQRGGQWVMPLLIYPVMVAWDWRTAFMMLAGTSFLLIVVPSLLYMRRQPEDYGLLPDGEVVAPASSGTGKALAPEVQWSLEEARKTRAFWMIILFTICTPFVQGATNLHMVANFQDKGMDNLLAVSVLPIFAFSAMASIFPMGLLLERMHVRYGAMLQAGVLITSLVVLITADTYWEAVVFAVLFGVAAGMRNIVETLLLANYYGRGSLGAIKGFTAPFKVISPMGPLFAGFIYDTSGSYETAFVTFIGVAFVMLFSMVAAKPPAKPRAPVEELQHE
jgi:MFS family permease